MAATLHNPQARAAIEARLRALTPYAVRRWGSMSVDQMLWHCNEGMTAALGERPLTHKRGPLPAPLMRVLVLNLPWPKGAPTIAELVPVGHYAFEAEHRRALDLVGRFAAQSLDAAWPKHPLFGEFSGSDYSRLIAKHLDHHLRQFGH